MSKYHKILEKSSLLKETETKSNQKGELGKFVIIQRAEENAITKQMYFFIETKEKTAFMICDLSSM